MKNSTYCAASQWCGRRLQISTTHWSRPWPRHDIWRIQEIPHVNLHYNVEDISWHADMSERAVNTALFTKKQLLEKVCNSVTYFNAELVPGTSRSSSQPPQKSINLDMQTSRGVFKSRNPINWVKYYSFPVERTRLNSKFHTRNRCGFIRYGKKSTCMDRSNDRKSAFSATSSCFFAS